MHLSITSYAVVNSLELKLLHTMVTCSMWVRGCRRWYRCNLGLLLATKNVCHPPSTVVCVAISRGTVESVDENVLFIIGPIPLPAQATKLSFIKLIAAKIP